MMTHVEIYNDNELYYKINETLAKYNYNAQVNELYYHYKRPDRYYRVLNIGIDKETEKVVVIYQAQYGNNLVFVRSIGNWCDNIEIDDKTCVKRFTHKNPHDYDNDK